MTRDRDDQLPTPGDDAVVDRLRDLRTPVPDPLRAEHVRRMATTTAGASAPRRRFGPLAVAAAAVVGFLFGSTGLAMAGALPDPAQDAAADVLGVVGIDVPAGKEGKRGPCVADAAKLEGAEAKRAAKDACPTGPFGVGPDGAPGRSGEAPGRSGDAPGRSTEAPGRSGDAPGASGGAPGAADADPCRGRPPWAGRSDLTDDEVAAAKAARDACVDEVDDVDG